MSKPLKIRSSLDFRKKAEMINSIIHKEVTTSGLTEEAQFMYDTTIKRARIHDDVSARSVIQDNDISEFNIDGIIEPEKLATREQIYDLVTNVVTGSTGVIGDAEDGTYLDGIYTDFTSGTPIGTAVDRFNEILKALSPKPPPELSSISIEQSGITARLSFDGSNPIPTYFPVTGIATTSAKTINDLYEVTTGQTVGVVTDNIIFTGDLNNNVLANSAFENGAFIDGNKGILQLEVNGTVVSTANISATTLAINNITSGTGFDISEIKYILLPDGITQLPNFTYRNGSYSIGTIDQRNGYNYARVIHDVGTTAYTSNYYEWVVDDATAVTIISASTLNNLVMSGSTYLSGIEFHTGGNAEYAVTLKNSYINTYYSGNDAIDFSATNCNVIDLPYSAITTNYLDDINLSGINVVVSALRLNDESISVGLLARRTFEFLNGSTVLDESINGLLVNNFIATSTDIFEDFDDEDYRISTDEDFDLTATTSNWNSTISLISATSGYSDGLQVLDSWLIYPNDNFSTFSNGPGNGGQIGGPNPNYSIASGNRIYIREYIAINPNNEFIINVQASSTTVVDLGTSLTGNNIHIELKLPTETGWLDCAKAFFIAQHNDGDGCANENGFIINVDKALNIGFKNTANSGDKVFVRITAPDTWIGYIESISFTFNND